MARATTLKPKALREGSTLALAAPAFPFDRNLFDAGLKALKESYKLNVVFRSDVFEKQAYLAGNHERRLQELLGWIADPKVNGILAVRGGYGCAHIYPDFKKELQALKRRSKLKPKILAGFSDLTILLNGIYQDFGWTTFHTPHAVSRFLRDADADAKLEAESFRQQLFSTKAQGQLAQRKDCETLVAGKAAGVIVGGCLSLLATSLGTPYEIQTKGKILFLEDVTEPAYRIDRMLTQLLHAGKLSGIKGLIIGQMTEITGDKKDPSITAKTAIEISILDYLRAKKIPTVFNFPAGHGKPQLSFAIGTKVGLECSGGISPKVSLLESGVA